MKKKNSDLPTTIFLTCHWKHSICSFFGPNYSFPLYRLCASVRLHPSVATAAECAIYRTRNPPQYRTPVAHHIPAHQPSHGQTDVHEARG